MELGLIGDAGSILTQLVDASRDAAPNSASSRQDWTGSLTQRKQDLGYYDDPEMHRDSSPVTPQRLVAIMNQCMPANTVFALDAGNNRTWMATSIKPHKPTPSSAWWDCGHGWGLPAAVGLKFVYRDRPVACVTGDGGYMMTVNAISTAMQYDLPIICFVFNDGALGMVRQHQPQRALHRFGVRGHGQRRGRQGVRGVRSPSQGFPRIARRHQRRPCVRSTFGGRCPDRPWPQSRRLARRRPQGRRDLSVVKLRYDSSN